MSCVASTIVAYGALATAVAGGVYSGYQQNKQANQASANARAQAEQQKQLMQQQEQDMNRANRRTADLAGIMSDPSLSSSSTNLTGASGVGVDPSKLGGGSGLLGG